MKCRLHCLTVTCNRRLLSRIYTCGGDAMRRMLTLLLSGVAILWSASFLSFAADSPKPPPLAAGGPKPLLSECAETKAAFSHSTRGERVCRPITETLESPHADVPFAVRVLLTGVKATPKIWRLTQSS
ncbi:MAG: hypothetical protein ACREVE_04745 [Gammaproteobacteria bacterium]